jgi:lipoate-protein ligase B
MPEDFLRHNGIELYQVDRGGRATFHEPGQLVVYPIIKLENDDVRLYVRTLLESAAAVLRAYGLNPEFKDGRPGLWVQSQKIVCVGVSVKKGVTYHGIAINVNNDLKGYEWIVPCGHSGEAFTSIMKEGGGFVEMSEVKRAVIKEFKRSFHYGDSSEADIRSHEASCLAGSTHYSLY